MKLSRKHIFVINFHVHLNNIMHRIIKKASDRHMKVCLKKCQTYKIAVLEVGFSWRKKFEETVCETHFY